MSNQEPNPMSEYYIAYFDILGYQDFFKETPEKASEFLNIIHTAITETKNDIDSFNNSNLQSKFPELYIQSKIFSDNFLLCIKTKSDNIEEKMRINHFIYLITAIQRSFVLKFGLFLRGGLTKGLLSINKDYVFGQGLIEAVKIEERTIHPRIAVSNKIINILVENRFYSPEEASKAISIENKFINNIQPTKEDIEFYKKLHQLGTQELIERKLGFNILYKCDDDTWSLSYLYFLSPLSCFFEGTFSKIEYAINNLKEDNYDKSADKSPTLDFLFEKHKKIIEQKLIKYSNYNSLEPDDINGFETYEKILKKYIWAMVYHNRMCQLHNKIKFSINTQNDYELRYMKLRIQVIDENGNVINQ